MSSEGKRWREKSLERWDKGDWMDEAKAQRAEVEKWQRLADGNERGWTASLAEVKRLTDALARIANTFGVVDGDDADMATAMRDYAFATLHPDDD